MGIEGGRAGSHLAQFFDVKEGVLVRSVLKAGDVVTEIDATPVLDSREISAGWQVQPAR